MLDYHLLEQYRETNDLKLRNKLIEQAIPLVHHVAHKMHKTVAFDHEYEDLAAYGYFGLIQAIDRFDLSKNTKFSTYAVPRIYGSILDEIRKIDWVPRSVRKKIRKVRDQIASLHQVSGGDVSDYELAKQCGLNIQEYYIMRNDFVYNITDCFYYYM